MKSEIFLRKSGPFVPEPGMWWNLDIFGKFAFELFLARVDYWYLWKTHFLSFRDFQESPNPLKIRILSGLPLASFALGIGLSQTGAGLDHEI